MGAVGPVYALLAPLPLAAAWLDGPPEAGEVRVID